MKYLILCEGSNEKTILELLLKENKLKFTYDDLIGLDIYHARQFIPYIISEVLMYNKDDIQVIRVGDTQKDELKIPASLAHLINKNSIIKCHTKPELEILLIINEGLFDKFNKVKSKIKPKTFAKNNITLNKKNYDCSCEFWESYYQNNINKLISNIKDCKKLTKNNKNEIYLADLLKKH